MNTSHSSGRHYRPEDFEPAVQIPMPTWLVVFLIIALVASHAAALYVGGWLQREQTAREAAALAVTLPPARKIPADLTAKRWECTSDEQTEYRRACWHRKKAELVQKITPKAKP